MDHLLGRSEVFTTQKVGSGGTQIQDLDAQQLSSLHQLSRLPAYHDVIVKLTETPNYMEWLRLDNPEVNVPVVWNDDDKLSKFTLAVFFALLFLTLCSCLWKNYIFGIFESMSKASGEKSTEKIVRIEKQQIKNFRKQKKFQKLAKF